MLACFADSASHDSPSSKIITLPCISLKMELQIHNTVQDEFHFFPNLPPELRHPIILLALRPSYPYVGGRGIKEIRRPPPIAEVNREARGIFLSMYTRLCSTETTENATKEQTEILGSQRLPLYAMLPQQSLMVTLWGIRSPRRITNCSWFRLLSPEALERTKHVICYIRCEAVRTVYSHIQNRLDAFPNLETLCVRFEGSQDALEHLSHIKAFKERPNVKVTIVNLRVEMYIQAKKNAQQYQVEYMDGMQFDGVIRSRK